MTKEIVMKCLIDGNAVPDEHVGPPAMNYGQLCRWQAYKRVEYEYLIATPDFIDRVSSWFANYCDELKADCKFESPQEKSPEWALAGLGYPRIGQLMRRERQLASRLFLSMPLELNNLFAPKTSKLIRYAANSVDCFSCESGEVRFGGVAFDMQSRK